MNQPDFFWGFGGPAQIHGILGELPFWPLKRSQQVFSPENRSAFSPKGHEFPWWSNTNQFCGGKLAVSFREGRFIAILLGGGVSGRGPRIDYDYDSKWHAETSDEFHSKDCFLGGGNSNIFFSPRSLGKWSNLTCAYFSDGLKPPPSFF